MTTNNHPANGPVSLDRLHQISEILSKASAQSDGGNLGYAMADAVKVIDGAIAAFGAEPVLYAAEETLAYAKMGELHLKCLSQPMGDAVIPLYTAPPAPEPMKDHQIRELVNDLRDIAVEYHGTQQLRERIARTVRAAMLQAGNSPSKCSLRDGIEAIRNSGIPVDVDKIQSERVAGNHTEQHLDMVDHSGDDNEKADCKLPFDQWLSQQNEPIDVDCGCVTTEAFYHWLRVAYEAGNSPVTQDGWIPVSERIPERDVDVQVYCADKKEQMVGYMERNETEGWFRFASLPNGGGVYCKPTHWMELPAAPQQEDL